MTVVHGFKQKNAPSGMSPRQHEAIKKLRSQCRESFVLASYIVVCAIDVL